MATTGLYHYKDLYALNIVRSRSKLNRMIANDGFPAPYKDGDLQQSRVSWRIEEVEAWLDAKYPRGKGTVGLGRKQPVTPTERARYRFQPKPVEAGRKRVAPADGGKVDRQEKGPTSKPKPKPKRQFRKPRNPAKPTRRDRERAAAQ